MSAQCDFCILGGYVFLLTFPPIQSAWVSKNVAHVLTFPKSVVQEDGKKDEMDQTLVYASERPKAATRRVAEHRS